MGVCTTFINNIFTTLFQSLLPKGCCRVTPYSHCYEESWKCNFLGMHPSVSLPHHMSSSELYVHIEISQLDESYRSSHEPKSLNSLDSDLDYSLTSDDCNILMRDYLFKVSSPVELPSKGELC